MRSIKKAAVFGAVIAVVTLGIQLRVDRTDQSEVPVVAVGVGTQAYARVGRPLTPVSVAGVSRRTARRTARRN